MSFFETVELLPEDPILGIAELFKAHKNKNKVNLGIGAYQDADGHPFVLNSVKKAEALFLQSPPSKEYLPIAGDADYIFQAIQLIFGENCPFVQAKEVFSAQTLGGSGALSLGSSFLAQEFSKKIFISNPSWPNHRGLLGRNGLRVETYPYYDEKNRTLNFIGMCNGIKQMPPGSAILLQPCCHNPTGMDLTFEQWQIFSDLIKHQNIFPFFDLAYQGFSQSLDEDVKPIRFFLQQGHEMMVAQSFAKNFGLYGERVGTLSIVTHNADAAKRVGSHVKLLIRQSYSNPPIHGAKIVSTLLHDPSLRKEWMLEVEQMKNRIHQMRLALVQGLTKKCPQHDFNFLANQKGMFSFSGLNESQSTRLRDEYGVFILLNGRINVAGLNRNNLDYVIDSLAAVL